MQSVHLLGPFHGLARILPVLLLWFWWAGTLPAAVSLDPEYGVVEITVEDDMGGVIPGFGIWIGAIHLIADDSGKVIFSKVPRGPQKVTADWEGVLQDIKISVDGREQVEYTLVVSLCMEFGEYQPLPAHKIRIYWAQSSLARHDAHPEAARLNRLGRSGWKIQYELIDGWGRNDSLLIESDGSIKIEMNHAPIEPFSLSRTLERTELKKLKNLLLKSRLFSGENEGIDYSPTDGSYERLTVVNRGVTVVLETTGNLSFCRPGPRRDLAILLNQFAGQAHSAAREQPASR